MAKSKSAKKRAAAARRAAQANARARDSAAAVAERTVAQESFLAEYRTRGIVLKACEAAKVGRRTVYDWLEADVVFRRAFEDAREDATDSLELEARRRATEGVEEPVFQGGDLVGHVTKYSDRLLEQMLKAHRPDKFRERYEHTGAGGGPIQVTKRVTFGGRYKPASKAS